MELRRLYIEPTELAALRPDHEETDDGFVFVAIGDGAAYTVVTANTALAISEAWRQVEQSILERQHGVGAMV